MVRLSYFLVAALVGYGCGKKQMTPEELNTYMMDADHGMRKSVQVGDTKVEVLYRPTDLWVHQELGDSGDSVGVGKLRKKYDPYYYFILSLSANDREALHQVNGGMAQYSELVQTLSFRMSDYVTVTTAGQDTIPVGDAMLNRTYGMNTSTDILFVFNEEKAKDKDWVQFNLNEFGLDIGSQRFRFLVADLSNSPNIY